ncbi:MAG TPA: class 1 fructose-bisphosphatase [Methylophaga aminisulfidivorans]|uniref:Fructose-1,6-bisphosphatase class 1 n=2 Tax=root TaxID=1 RepID=A0A7C2A998_9GAMM|nr:class 1 fructose-bisphosphatase [Methylophaga aminisulfidivorans]
MTVKGQSVQQFLQNSDKVNASLSQLIITVTTACKEIADLVERSSILGVEGLANSINVQGEDQKQLDVMSNDVMVEHLSAIGLLDAMVSEEIEDVIDIPSSYSKGEYLICFDPLDGSSNIDINLSVGTIFSILHAPKNNHKTSVDDFLKTGEEQICAGFCVYGPSTMLILTIGAGVFGFTLDKESSEFVLTHPDMSIPENTAEFAINMSNQRYWEPPVQRYIAECIAGIDGSREKNFNMRWNASMVAEVYRILVRGGIFMYPIDKKIAQQGGKLRLLYEANPMSFIIEQAGGVSSSGKQRIMAIKPDSIHQRVPVILGSKNEVDRLVSYHQ